MRQLLRSCSIVGLCVVLTACGDGPLPFLSGGELGGTVVETPEIWQLAEDSAVAQLETRPDDPYSINLTYVQLDGVLYIYAGNTRTNWVQHIEQNPLIRVRVNGDTIYPGKAIRVLDADELGRFAAAWDGRDPLQWDEVWLYRVVARQG